MKYLLALHQSRAFTTATLNQLLAHLGSAQAVYALTAAQQRQLGLTAAAIAQLQKPDWAAVDRALQWAEQPQQHILTLQDPRYPALLKEIYDPPSLLYIIGEPRHLQNPQLAIVGSRHATPAGLELAQQFACHLAEAGLSITSGLALGIDGASHRGALQTTAATIAVLGNGLSQIYPYRHRALAQKIRQQGALISEYPLHTAPHRSHFPQRNRIISGLSLGTLVVEAALKSGSLITARMASEQGREVFAIPGSIHNPTAHGCHALIRQGATLVEQASDIIAALGPMALAQQQLTQQQSKPPLRAGLDATHQKLLKCVEFAPTAVNLVIARSALPAAMASAMLLQLELQGYIQQTITGYIRVA